MIQNIPYKFNPFPVYKAASQPVTYNSLTFIGKDSTNAVQLNAVNTPVAITLQYSKNGGTWTNYTIGSVIELSSNQTVAFSGANDHFSNPQSFYQFAMTGTIEAHGNIQSLLNFSDSCTNWCYGNMFFGCTSLITPPQLPATTLADGCYASMFWGCSNLSTAPSLPVTTLASDCYSGMFGECTSLTDAPELPATTLVNNCYFFMFYQCSSLTGISVSFTDWNQATELWLFNVSSTGTFTCPSNLDTTIRDISHVPANWTVINT